MSNFNQPTTPVIGLALSGGGARAMAFHLGCMRALHDRRLLQKVAVLSTVSGGSVIGACWAYWDCDFVDFDKRITSLLREGVQRSIFFSAFFSVEVFKILATLFFAGVPAAMIGIFRMALKILRIVPGLPVAFIDNWLAKLSCSLPIWGSLTTAFERALRRKLFGDSKLADVKRAGLEVVINACDLRTGTAFRFGSVNLVEQPPAVAYFDEFEQRWKRHFFDFLADMADGSKMALAVRPKARSEKVLDILKAIAGQVRGFADAYGRQGTRS